MVLALQTMVTRSFDVFDPVVVTVGRIAGGHQGQHHPRRRRLRGDRCAPCRRSTGRKCASGSSASSTGIAAAHGLTVEVDFSIGYPVTVNDVDEYAFAQEAVVDLFGADRYSRLADPGARARRTCRSCCEQVPERLRQPRRVPRPTTTSTPRTTTRRGPPSTTRSCPTRRPAGRDGPAAAQPLSTRRVSGSGARTATAATWDGSPSSTSASCTGPSSGCSPRQDTRAGCSFGPVTMT